MPRIPRLTNNEQATVYHVMSRTALGDFPLGDTEKDFLLNLIKSELRIDNSNEAVLPFYILHQTVILCVGWFVIRWNIGMLPKFLIITVASFALIMALYKLLVRHFNIVRFFFGMRSKKRIPGTAASIPEGIAG